MLLLGLLILAATGAFTGLLISENLSGSPQYTVQMFGNDVTTQSTLGAFLSGIALALIFCLGLAMLASGAARHRRRNRELRTARHRAATTAAERDALAARIGEGTGTGADTGATEPGYVYPPGPPRAEPEVRAPSSKRRRRHGVHLFGH
jgi:hypothetical protein